MAIRSDKEYIDQGQSEVKSDWQEVFLSWLTLPNIIALTVMIGYVYFLIRMLGLTAVSDEKIWTRAAFLLTGYEAIAFAAAGYIFGKEVHRQQAEIAQQNAKLAQEERDIAKACENEALAKGYRLAEAVKARASASPRDDLVPKEICTQDVDFDYLANLANKLFP